MNESPYNFPFWRKLAHWIGQESNILLKVIQSHGLFVLIGLMYGVGLVVLSKFTPDIWKWFFNTIVVFNNAEVRGASTASLVIKEIGMGFIVASIAVFGYEWRSHAKKALELSERLTEILEREAKESLSRSVRFLVNENTENQDFCNDIINFINATNSLGSKSTADSAQYIKVLSWIFQETVKKNADNLEGLIKDSAGAEWHYKVPSATEVASRILGAQIRTLKKGDSYDSVSIIESWQDESLNYFLEETDRALREGVNVRRIFNLCNSDCLKLIRQENSVKIKEKNKRKLAKISEAVKKHKSLSEKCEDNNQKYKGKYKIKYLLSTSSADKNKGFKSAELKIAHYGLFRHSKSKKIIKFVAQTRSLSKIGLGHCQADDADVRKFDVLWEIASEKNPFEESNSDKYPKNNSNSSITF